MTTRPFQVRTRLPRRHDRAGVDAGLPNRAGLRVWPGRPARRHHRLRQAPRHRPAVIDILQGMQDRAAWVCLYAPDAVQEFIDELKAREVQPPEDSFCVWCHHRDERRRASSSATR